MRPKIRGFTSLSPRLQGVSGRSGTVLNAGDSVTVTQNVLPCEVPPSSKLRIAIVGLNFGSDFVPIYQAHPDVAEVVVCDARPETVAKVAERFDVARRYERLEEVLAAEEIDAVHLLTPVPLHAEQSVAVLESGKHCACAVPMATSLDDLRRVVEAANRSDRQYMMMETAVYTREFLYAQDLLRRGELGKLTFLRGTYFQDLEGAYPDYWRAQPPMHYATHAIAPVLALAEARVERVCCFGSGRLRPDLQMPGGNTFALQTAILKLADSDLAAEVTHSWFQVARAYTEAFSVYGEQRGFEWQQIEEEEPILFTLGEADPARRGKPCKSERINPPFRPDLLPPELAPFVEGWHGGSHPHLVQAFVRSCVENRPSAIDAARSADWCAPGICANESSLQNGQPVAVPTFEATQNGATGDGGAR